MTNIRKILTGSITLLALAATPATPDATRYHQFGRQNYDVNAITYHKNAHTIKRPSSIEAYRGYSVERTDLEINDGYLTVIAKIYSDRPKEAFIWGAYEKDDENHLLKRLAFPNTIINTTKLLREKEGITKIHLNKKRQYQ